MNRDNHDNYNDLFDSSGDAGDEGSDENSKKGSSEFAQMLEQSFSKKTKRLSVGDKIRGEILVIGKEEVFVSTGTPNDGIVPRRDLLDAEGKVPYKTGDQLDLFVTQVKGSEIYLSPKPTAKNMAGDLYEAYQSRLALEGKVTEVVNGGFRVNVKGKLAFCPISQMDIKRIETPEEYVGKRFEFKITKFEEGGRNIVVSRRRLLEEARDLTVGNFASENKPGSVVRGRVSRLEPFGAFIELQPGIDGLAHISELSWSRVGHPSEVLQVGQEVAAKVLKLENQEGRLRISLSIKQTGAEPWENMPNDIRAGQVVTGKVTRIAKFGAFVELTPGVEGLIPLSEMSYTKRVMRADEVVKEGEQVAVMIKEVDPQTRRIGLSLKDAGEDPWSLVAHKFPVGAVVSGKVERREPYGLFIKLDDGITGLLPKSKANENPEFPFEKLKIGDTATVQVGELRVEERRISLQVPKDPGSDDWKGFVASPGSSGGGLGTLGGAFGDKLKAALEKKKK